MHSVLARSFASVLSLACLATAVPTVLFPSSPAPAEPRLLQLSNNKSLCLTAFNETVFFTFEGAWSSLMQSSAGQSIPLIGHSFGAIAPCGTNGSIPLTGTATLDGSGQVVLGWQLHSVDIPSGCGSVEYKVVLDLETQTGPLSLWNTRNEFENTSTAIVRANEASLPLLSGLNTGDFDRAGNPVAP